jgi:bla regulator protein BlaR1
LSIHLSACEVESILLHELSHIKRNDYLANLLQQAVSVILFFNPFTWLINRIINEERENSCDDLVIQKTGKPLIYANALLKLEQSRYSNLQLALSLTGNKFHLLNRIERIMKTQKRAGNIRHSLLGLMLLIGSVAGVAWFNPASAKKSNAKPNLKSAIVTSKGDSLSNNTIDTGKHSHLVVKNKITHKKAIHHPVKMVRRSSDSSWCDSLADYYHSPEWKAQMAAIRKQSEEIKKHFDSPEWKAQVLAMQKQGEDIRKQFDSPEWKKQMEDIKKQGEEMKKQFDSPEWKKQMEDIKKQGEEMKKQFDSPEWKKQMEDIKKQGEEMKKQFDSPEWKKQMEDIKKQSKEMKKEFDSPEWKKQVKELKKYKGEKWILKDSVGGVGIYRPAEKDTVN